MMRDFAEACRIEQLALAAPRHVHLEMLDVLHFRGQAFPLQALIIGEKAQGLPTLGLFAGVHGLERIGTHIVLAYLESLIARLTWDKDVQWLLRKSRIVTIPMVNPSGVFYRRRCNPRGIDLMRNAPVEAEGKVLPLLGGHRLSAKLPWYRGENGLEREAQALIDFVQRELFPAPAALSLDVHSGFGFHDRLWFPYAKTRRPFPSQQHVQALISLFDHAYPYHVYHIEQQSQSYTAHGDLWDYLYDEHQRRYGSKQQIFIPWTLEIGSWKWLRKNPRQILTHEGAFHPIIPHRYHRTMRRHLLLLDFFAHAVRNSKRWLKQESRTDATRPKP
jgi:hypothetical protein